MLDWYSTRHHAGLTVIHISSFLILHGLANHRPPAHWQFWLAARLAAEGHFVLYPGLPAPDAPSLVAWQDDLYRHLGMMGGGDRTVICHSLGVCCGSTVQLPSRKSCVPTGCCWYRHPTRIRCRTLVPSSACETLIRPPWTRASAPIFGSWPPTPTHTTFAELRPATATSLVSTSKSSRAPATSPPTTDTGLGRRLNRGVVPAGRIDDPVAAATGSPSIATEPFFDPSSAGWAW